MLLSQMVAVAETAAAVAGGLAAQGAQVEAFRGVRAAGAAIAAADVAMRAPQQRVERCVRFRHPGCPRHGVMRLRGVLMLRLTLLLRVLVGSCTAGGAVVVTGL